MHLELFQRIGARVRDVVHVRKLVIRAFFPNGEMKVYSLWRPTRMRLYWNDDAEVGRSAYNLRDSPPLENVWSPA